MGLVSRTSHHRSANDVILRIVRTCVAAGSDLWSYRDPDIEAGVIKIAQLLRIVEEIGEAITTVKPGDFVIAPFTHGCGECDACRAGWGRCDRILAQLV